MLTASLIQNFKRKKNWYLWKSVSPSKKKYPYYAKFWFFIGILTLGWMTPMTRYWEEFLLWETTTGYPIREYNAYGIQMWTYVYKVNGKDYQTGISGGRAGRLVKYLDLPNGMRLPENQKYSHMIKQKYSRSKIVKIPPRDKTIRLYVNPQNPGQFFHASTDFMYKDENLFFPVALQIGMIAFFIAVRYK